LGSQRISSRDDVLELQLAVCGGGGGVSKLSGRVSEKEGVTRTDIFVVCLILLIGSHGQINLEAEGEHIDPNEEQHEQEQPPLLVEETPSCFLQLDWSLRNKR